MTTNNPFNDLRHPHMARGDFMFGGMAVVIDPRIAPEHIGDEVAPHWPHWLYTWFVSKVLHRAVLPWWGRGKPITCEVAYEAQGKLFMSPRGWDALKQQVRPRG